MKEKRYLNPWFQHSGGPYSQSLCQIPMPTPTNLSSIDANLPIRKHNLNPTLLFHSTQYPVGRSCVHFNDKLYFLGGFTLFPDEDGGSYEYQKDVYVYDPTTSVDNEDALTRTKNLPKVASMNTIKPSPFPFIHHGKLYVLSDGPHMKYFEFYDFSNDILIPLPDPPRLDTDHHVSIILSIAIVNNKLYMFKENKKIQCFDLDTRKWLPSHVFSITHHFDRLIGKTLVLDNFVYAPFGSSIAAFGPIIPSPSSSIDNDEDVFSLFSYSILNNDNLAFLPPKYAKFRPSHSLAHFGGTCLCYVTSRDQSHPLEPETTDNETHNVSLTIFEPTDLPLHNKANPKKHSIAEFSSKLMLTAHFSLKNYDATSHLLDSFSSTHWFGNRDAERDLQFWYVEAKDDDPLPPTEEAIAAAAYLEIKALRAAFDDGFEVAIDLFLEQ